MPRAPRKMSASDERRTYVLDTNVLIADPEAPSRFEEHDVVIPLTVVEELDKLKTRVDETGGSARRAIRVLEDLRAQGNLSQGVALPGHERVWIEEGYSGVATVEVTEELSELYANRGGEILTPQPLWTNQFVVLRAGTQSALGQVRASAAAGEPATVTLIGEVPDT